MTSRPARRPQPAARPRKPNAPNARLIAGNSPHQFVTQPMRAMRAPQAAPVIPRAVRPVRHAPAYSPPPAPRQPPPSIPAGNRRRPAPRRQPARAGSAKRWLVVTGGVIGTVALLSCMLLTIGAFMLFGSGMILPGVQSAGIPVGGQTPQSAAQTIAAAWSDRGVVLRDGNRDIPVDPGMLGIALDAGASAQAAFDISRASVGAALRAALGPVDVAPVVTVDAALAGVGLLELASQVEQPAVNAGIQLINGQVQPRPAVTGRALDVGLTLAKLERDPGRELADGALDLVMRPVEPDIRDAGPLVQAASALLANPLHVRAWDPIDDDIRDWSIPPQDWGNWLTGTPDPSAPFGLRLSLDSNALSNYFTAQADLDSGEYIDVDNAIGTLQQAVSQGRNEATVRVYHHDASHTVQSGETVISIAWDYGVPYPWILRANPGADGGLSVGQTITVPSADNFMDFEPVYGKRIVVSISEQHVWVYENGGLKWDWIASTGIQSSPTWPGIYQIISHEPNAYAGNWDLYMPNFMGVYRPIPGSDFTNGFHGFPTRGGWQLLWTNSLGTRVTYGCILLSDENSRLLYEWAEEGVVVEIRA